jgi:hypothetical protein
VRLGNLSRRSPKRIQSSRPKTATFPGHAPSGRPNFPTSRNFCISNVKHGVFVTLTRGKHYSLCVVPNSWSRRERHHVPGSEPSLKWTRTKLLNYKWKCLENEKNPLALKIKLSGTKIRICIVQMPRSDIWGNAFERYVK